MTNASIKNTFSVLSVFVIATALSMGAFATIAHAQSDGGYIDTSGDNGGYVDTSGYNGGYVDTSGNNGGYVDTSGYNGGYVDTSGSNGGYVDTSGYNGGYVDTGVTSGTDVYGTDVTYDNGVGYSYNNYGYDYGTSYTPSYSYSMPSLSFGAPTSYYSNPVVYSAPQQQQQQQQQQIRTVSQPSQPINIVNNNNNTNNNNNSNPVTVTTVTPIASAGTQYPVQYVYQQPTYTYPYNYNYNYQTYNNISCYISASQNTLTSGQTTYLSWSAPGASSAWLSGVGSVSPNSSISVSPYTSTTYTLTVSGYGGSNTCSVYVAVAAPYYNNTPSVSLSQIPYTGFDFGPFGNAMYWLALLSFAAAGAYLLVYYSGNAMSFATGAVGNVSSKRALNAPVPVVAAIATQIEKVVEPVRASFSDLPVMESRVATTDSMVLSRSKNGEAPRIVIVRD